MVSPSMVASFEDPSVQVLQCIAVGRRYTIPPGAASGLQGIRCPAVVRVMM